MKCYSALLLSLGVVLILPSALGQSGPVVGTAQGQLLGSILKTITGKDIYSFRGVRFAEPPIGALRFKNPVPPSSWRGIRNATEDGAVCPQQDFRREISEDCLFLNVYTTKLPKGKNNPKRPVVVFFHPGAFFSVTGISIMYGPQYWLDKDIVLVTNNYRLGALGFISANDSVLPGNYGVKDQVQVLRWVKQNIASFGGDPDSVTIVGYSAGSISVFLHMLSPMSKGLFHRCIAMSASPIPSKVVDPVTSAQKVAAILNCRNDSTQEIVDCLRQKDAVEIADTLGKFREWGWDPLAAYRPVVEPDFGDGAERFLTADPQELFLAGNFSQVPLITGITTEEFGWEALQVLGNNSLTEDMDHNFERVAPISFGYERDTDRSRNISRELRQFYFKDQPISNATVTELGQIYSDSIIIFNEDRAAKIISNVSSAPVYYYKFAYQGRFSHIYNPPDSTTPYGVVHHDDLIYLFHIAVLFPMFNTTDPEFYTVLRMTSMWTNFVETGNPTPKNSELLDNVRWQPFTSQNLKYLEIGSSLEMKQGLYQDRMAVWDRLFPVPDRKY